MTWEQITKELLLTEDSAKWHLDLLKKKNTIRHGVSTKSGHLGNKRIIKILNYWFLNWTQLIRNKFMLNKKKKYESPLEFILLKLLFDCFCKFFNCCKGLVW